MIVSITNRVKMAEHVRIKSMVTDVIARPGGVERTVVRVTEYLLSFHKKYDVDIVLSDRDKTLKVIIVLLRSYN